MDFLFRSRSADEIWIGARENPTVRLGESRRAGCDWLAAEAGVWRGNQPQLPQARRRHRGRLFGARILEASLVCQKAINLKALCGRGSNSHSAATRCSIAQQVDDAREQPELRP
jgi:hypothetical protein